MTIEEELVQAWDINARITLYLLDAIEETHLDVKPLKGRTVRGQFCHLHNVRLMWLKSGAPELLEGCEKLDTEFSTKTEIMSALVDSAKRIARMIADNAGEGKRVKGFKPTTTAFMAYLVAHESHHRGMTELSLRQLGHPVSDKVSFGLWEWGTR